MRHDLVGASDTTYTIKAGLLPVEVKYLLDPLVKHYADFSGRANRKQFWLYALWLCVVYIVIGILSAALGEKAGNAVIVLVWLALIVPNLAMIVRRLHDTDRSGWWVLISFLPLIGGLILFVFEVLPGTPGENRFGSQPQN